ncbi:MAG: aminopeptidase [Spirochaetota bacterium]
MTSEQLANYADLILWCVEGFEGHNVHVRSETLHRPLVTALLEASYRRGARTVSVEYQEPAEVAARIRHADPENLGLFPGFQAARYEELADGTWTAISVAGQADPEYLAGMDPDRVARYMKAHRTIYSPVRTVVSRFELPWVGVLMPTQALAERAFPNESPDAAYRKYEQAIVDVLHLDDDPVSFWKGEFARLIELRDRVNALGFDSLKFTGPGTELDIGLHRGGEFMAAEETLPTGRTVRVNMPSCEIFTTPDARRVNGRIATTRPFQSTSAPGKIVRDAWFEFRDGAVVEFGATEGEDILARVLDMDDRARYLGEVALVSADSPVARQAITFGHMLYDENAACHIALGSGFPRLVPGASELDAKAAVAAGVNHSLVHDDMMVGSEAVDVTGVMSDGTPTPIIREGRFVL